MWTNDKVLGLINLYKSNRCLWDNTHDNFKNKIIKNETWEEIASIMNLPRREVEMKIHGLRSQFIRERKRNKMAAQGLGYVRQSTWFAYDSLMFLVKDKDEDSMDTIIRHEINQDSQSTVDSESEGNLVIDTSVNTDIVENILDTTQKHRQKIYRKTTHEATKSSNYNHYVSAKKKDRDEFDIYGQYIASELRNVKTEHSVLMAKYYVNNIILKARMGKFDGETVKDQNDYDFNAMAGSSSQDVSSYETPLKKLKKNDEQDLVVEVKCEPDEN